MMKKSVFACMAAIFLCSLTACGSSSEETGEIVTAPEAPAEETENGAQDPDADGPSETAEPAETDSGDAESMAASDAGETKALVVYFSATGNTKAAAETLAGLQGADLYEIVPEEPYTEEDLDYNDRTTRATAEQNDPDARPVMAGEALDIDSYEMIYVGYPIWWGDMPRILYTFFDAYDLTGKTVAPFCTSGGSGLSGTPDRIQELEAGAEVTDGLAISGSGAADAESDLKEWLAAIGQQI